jgi:PAS domain S-box-containing protein
MKTSLHTEGSLDSLKAATATLPQAIELLLETMAEGVGVLDGNNTLTYANRALAGILGMDPSILTGTRATDLLDSENREIFESERKSAASGTPCSHEIAWTRPDKSHVHTVMSLNCGGPQAAPADTCLLVLRDINMQKRAERHLIQSQRMDTIEALAGGIAHDLNNMLSIITGNISVLANATRDSDSLVQLRDTEKASAQARKLTKQLMSLAKGGPAAQKPTNLNELLRETSAIAVHGAKMRYKLCLDDSLPAVTVDYGQVSQAVCNILMNACQAMPDGGTVEVISSTAELEADNPLRLSPGRYAKVIIKDQGMGIAGEHIARIFEPFFTTKPQATGLGLTTADSIIREHKGAITVYSQPGQGAEFHTYIPAPDSSKAEAEQEKERTRRGKALLMDDNQQMLQMLQRIIRRLGYDTVSAENGTAAIAAYRKAMEENQPFTFVLFDITVPGDIGGAEAFKEILALDPFAKGIVASGYANDPIMANYKDYGFSSVVAKPFFLKELTDAVEAALSAKPRS